jgi:hypothetical protein
MRHTCAPAVVEIYLCQPNGVRIELLDYVTSYEYALIANDVGPFSLRMPFTFNRNNIKLDNIIEIWRGHDPGTLKNEYTGFIRGWTFGDEAGMDYTVLYGSSLLDLLKRRIVMDYVVLQSEMTDYADDMIKAIVVDQLGSDAISWRDLTSVGGGLTVQNDMSAGVMLTKEFEYRNALEVCQEIAAASKQDGTDIYFDIMPVYTSVTTGMIGLQLQTFANQRGNDRSWDSSTPVYVGIDWGNLENGTLDYDYTDEKNFVYALGPGKDESQSVLYRRDDTRANKSIWNECEGVVNAGNVEYDNTAELEAEAFAYLDANKPKMHFSGDIVETPAFRYGHDWWYGDRVTVVYAGIEKDAFINRVHVSRSEDGQETITAKIEFEES